MPLTPDRQRLSSADGRGSLAFAAALSVEVALAVIDIALLPPNVLVTIGVLLPLLCALYSRPRDVAIVGVVAIVLVLASVVWREDFGAAPYLQRVFIVSGGAILATIAAAGRAASRTRSQASTTCSFARSRTHASSTPSARVS